MFCQLFLRSFAWPRKPFVTISNSATRADSYQPITGQYSGHVICYSQSLRNRKARTWWQLENHHECCIFIWQLAGWHLEGILNVFNPDSPSKSVFKWRCPVFPRIRCIYLSECENVLYTYVKYKILIHRQRVFSNEDALFSPVWDASIYLSCCESVDVGCLLLLFLSPLITPQSGPAAVILLQTQEARGEGLILGHKHWVNTVNTTLTEFYSI